MIQINVSVKARTEHVYLLHSNRERCHRLLQKKTLAEEEIIDFLIALHLVLEIGINALFRHIVIPTIKKEIDEFKIMKNLDNVSFRDKVTMFVYTSNFDFSGKLEIASQYHQIIEKLKDFSSIRNQLLHGHSISTIYTEEGNRHSELRKAISSAEFLKRHIEKFRFIMEGMRFYLDALGSSLTASGREGLKKEYLDYSFLSTAK
ncbi:MAG: hypothetical protein A2664_02975 [Candidatus Taylorbacteria bacterium RIFCSPHIGHO2_01_FULL_46_22b]|uniref:Uncharacterized protein n=1 Tax=Candidatus Taylorbacteria bacterium RIFCSPHIGHO2_01_FULL_46_22b TaxID=1802301 RepID=A0A1G2M3T7_9BACT|nr:MAG: hypothetical protein A2664_02975 [Candidatus Taylorbacteria bacterium RIFCSPHIGHO2_01_FULL_46_22b]